MDPFVVSITRYQKPFASVKEAIALSGGLDRLTSEARVFIKPNIVFWPGSGVFPKWGVITTSRVVEDAVLLLKENGVTDITIGEGMVLSSARDRETPARAFQWLGYDRLKER